MLNKNERKNLKIINDFIVTNIDDCQTYAWQLGYKKFGLLLFGFCTWIHDQNKDNKLFFLARDGYIVKRAYNLLYPNEKTKYLYVSRRSLSLPSMKNAKNIEDILDCLVLPPLFTIEILLSVFDLDKEDVAKALKKANISKEETFKRSTYKENQKIKVLLKCLFLKIMNKVEEQVNNFQNYLSQEDFKGKVSIVDIGWHNSLQKQLLNIIEKGTTINGYYLGVYKNACHFNIDNQARGYIYSYEKNIEEQYKSFSFVSLLETMFLSHEGTTKGYKKNESKIIPQLAQYEYSDDQENLYIISEFQKGALKFIEDYKMSGLSIKLNSNICSYNILQFGSFPKKKNIELFGKLSFENYKIHNIINFNKSSIYYFTHPKEMVNDFYTSGWRVAFLKKLFKLPLPYYYLIKVLCIIFKKEQ